ncbi:MAG TPA: hypothetical protein VGN01_13405 [Acidobacteriaceae bacterium]|jgi:hypothetical protein
MRPQFFHVVGVVLLCLIAGPALCQTRTPAERLISARALYYTPTTAGLKSFGCQVSFDWKTFLSNVAGKDIQDDNAFLQYLVAGQMSVKDDLRGSGDLKWSSPAAPAKNLEAAAAKMQNGLDEMFSGFFKSWNAYLNGSMVPIPDKTVTLTTVADGMHLHAAYGTTTIDEDFDKNMLLKEAHVVTPEMDVLAMPVFTDTPDGRLLAEIHNEVRQPVSAPPAYANISVVYQQVGAYRLPETIRYDLKNVAQMDFKLSDCTVNSDTPRPLASPSAKR